MSTYEAISAVSASLQALLKDRMESVADVTLAPPGIEPDGLTRNVRVNLYLYRIIENAALKNQEIPGQGHASAYGHPPLSLNLHYLLTAYTKNEKSADAEKYAQLALGDAMRVLHDFAHFSPQLSEKATPANKLLDAVLREEFERIKITLEPLSLDELSKIWTSLPQTGFRRSVSYEVSVVQIESRILRRPVLPVQKRSIQLSLSRRPEITAVYRKPGTGEPAGDPRTKVLQTIVIKGSGFLAPQTLVRIGKLTPAVISPINDGEIEITVPDIPTLQPGTQEVVVSVRHEAEAVEGGLGHGQPPVSPPIITLESNRGFFLLVPEVASVNPTTGTPAINLTVTGKRLYRSDLDSYVLIGDVAIPVKEPQPNAPDEITIPLKSLANTAKVKHVVRILVNGAQSLETNVEFKLS